MTNLLTTAAAVLSLVISPGGRHALQPYPPQSPIAGVSATKIELPPPTGHYFVGTKIYSWVDDARREMASKNLLQFRQVIVQVWYPTEDQSGPRAPYVQMLSAYRRVWQASEVDVARRTLTHSRLNTKPLPSVRAPIVLLSHGWEGTRSEYTSLAEDLASHGYAVFGVDHPYMGRIALPNGEVTEATESQFHSPAEIALYYASDLEFVIQQIAELNRADPDKIFVGRFDETRMAAIGHSSGFVAASGACKLDTRIRACVNIDAPGFLASDLVGLNQPLLWIRLEKASSVPAGYLKTAASAVYELQIEHANHGSVEDWDYLEAASPAQQEAAARVLQIIRQYVEAFLSRHLDHGNSQLLVDDRRPGIHWRVYVPARRSKPLPKHP